MMMWCESLLVFRSRVIQPNDKRAGAAFGVSLAVDDDSGTIVVGSYMQARERLLSLSPPWCCMQSLHHAVVRVMHVKPRSLPLPPCPYLLIMP